ncbi:hypothetical protein GGF41_005670, partial [Coemansia sp. RSA 2531]
MGQTIFEMLLVIPEVNKRAQQTTNTQIDDIHILKRPELIEGNGGDTSVVQDTSRNTGVVQGAAIYQCTADNGSVTEDSPA